MLKVILRVTDGAKVRNKQLQEAVHADPTSTRQLDFDECGG